MKKLLFGVVLIGLLTAGGTLGYNYWKGRTPEGYYDAGKKFFDNKKYPEATISFLNAVRGNGHLRDARYYLALAYLNQQDVNHAAGQLKALLELYPDDVDANLQLGRI